MPILSLGDTVTPDGIKAPPDYPVINLFISLAVATHRYLTLREWGARQDPAMSVEEVVAAKMADKRKVEITLEDIMDAVTPF